MYIAKQKRKENIAEYILYIWQLEDLFRAFGMNLDLIDKNVVACQDQLSQEQRQQVLFWYEDLINLLKSEGNLSHGHLEHTMHLLSDLNDLHLQLLSLPIGADYAAKYLSVKPEIDKIRQKMGKMDRSDIEVCFRALYSVILLRLKRDDTNNPYIDDVLEVISPFIALLADFFKKVERGDIDLYEGVE